MESPEGTEQAFEIANLVTLLRISENRIGPKEVSTNGVSMNRPLLPIFRAFLAVVSHGTCQKSP